MSRLRIISLAHRATWSDVICQDALEKMSSLKEGSSCWLNLNESHDRRSGIYKVSKLKRENYIAAHFVVDNEISDDYKCLEKILQEDGCLPDGRNVPIALPKATKIILILDLKKGLCYSFYPGALLNFDIVKITAEGDLDSNYDWRAYEESVNDNEKWKIVGYRRPTNDSNDLFRLYNRKKTSDIALPDTEELE